VGRDVHQQVPLADQGVGCARHGHGSSVVGYATYYVA
jgi:hypothetical protein